jgi:hypothetical protein
MSTEPNSAGNIFCPPYQPFLRNISTMNNNFTPPQSGLLGIIKSAIEAVPAVRYALGVAGIGAAVALVAGFAKDFKVAVFGIIIMFVLMTVLVVFSRFVVIAAGGVQLLALVLAWAFVIIIIAAVFLLFTSFFLEWPHPITHYFGGPAPTPTPVSVTNYTPTPSVATPTPTVTPTITPTITPTPTATASPTPKPTPLIDPNDSFDDRGGQMVADGYMVHKCPDGYAMLGIDIGNNVFKCRRIVPQNEVAYIKTVVDKETQRAGMRACPVGMYMSGFALAPPWIVCSYNSKRGLLTKAVETQAMDPNPRMHLCDQPPNQLAYMVGFNYASNKFYLCGAIPQP